MRYLGPPPGLQLKEKPVAASYAATASEPSPARTLITIVEVPELKDETEKLNLTTHVRPREYPGQCPRFPAAKELIQQKCQGWATDRVNGLRIVGLASRYDG